MQILPEEKDDQLKMLVANGPSSRIREKIIANLFQVLLLLWVEQIDHHFFNLLQGCQALRLKESLETQSNIG